MGRRPERPVGPDVWATCRELIPAGSVYGFLAEHRDELFPEAMFADLYPSPNGRPSVPPQILATATVLQVLENLTDWDTLTHLRCDLRWKAACGLGLNDTAFDPSLLIYFRRRLAGSADPDRIFAVVREVIAHTGVLTGRRRRALDSTVFADAVATQDTVTQLISAIRRVAREVPGGAETVKTWCTGHDYLAGPGKPRIAWDDEQARAELVDALVTDAIRVLGHLPDQEWGEKAANAVGILALVAGQDVEPAQDSDGTDGRWRIARRTTEGRMVSTVDPEARHVHTTRRDYRDGFKAHVCLEPQTGLFTDARLTRADGPEHHEAAVAEDLIADDIADGDGLILLGDAAYGTAGLRATLTTAGHTLILKPPPLRPAVPGGFTLDEFRIDTDTNTVTCPAGHTTGLAPPGGRYHQRRAVFGPACTGCPLRAKCTTATTGRVITIRPHHDLQAAARHQAATDPAWQDEYRQWRPLVERGIAWLTHHARRLHYRGVIKNNAWLRHRIAALNLRRLITLGLDHTNGTWVINTATP